MSPDRQPATPTSSVPSSPTVSGVGLVAVAATLMVIPGGILLGVLSALHFWGIGDPTVQAGIEFVLGVTFLVIHFAALLGLMAALADLMYKSVNPPLSRLCVIINLITIIVIDVVLIGSFMQSEPEAIDTNSVPAVVAEPE